MELSLRGIHAARQVPTPISYKARSHDEEAFKIDLLVENSLVMELKPFAAISSDP